MTVRENAPAMNQSDDPDQKPILDAGSSFQKENVAVDEEGVFVVVDGVVTFTPIRIGIAGQEYFEVLTGIDVGDNLVAGPYQMIRELEDGDIVNDADDTDGFRFSIGGGGSGNGVRIRIGGSD